VLCGFRVILRIDRCRTERRIQIIEERGLLFVESGPAIRIKEYLQLFENLSRRNLGVVEKIFCRFDSGVELVTVNIP
jgi:hypothetical protein